MRQEKSIAGRALRRLRREGAVIGRPDYALKVGGERVLYIDAKRFDVDIEDNDGVCFQVRGYGWSSGFRVSYAYNFPEPAIWDCQPQPKAEGEPRVARLHFFKYGEYVA